VVTPVPAVLCVDIEPDRRECDVPSAPSWPGADRLLADDGWLRAAMGDHDAPINWFVRSDPQVAVCHGTATWALERYAVRLDELTAAGDQVGLHPHNWRWDGDRRRWTIDNGDPWSEHCVNTAFDGYERVLGRPCLSYRHGDRFMSDAIAARLRARGVEVDLTLEPGAPAIREVVPGVTTIGVTPHVDAAAVRPYRPSSESFAVADDDAGSALTMVPLTTGALPGRPAPETAYLWREPGVFAVQLELLLLDPGRRHLAFAIRSDMALDGEHRTNVEANLRTLVTRVPTVRWLPATALADAARPVPGAPDPGPLGAIVTALQERTEQADRAAAELEALRAAVDDLGTRLAVMEATMTWRTRARLLPFLRRIRRAGR
jgi:hypothetical protein